MSASDWFKRVVEGDTLSSEEARAVMSSIMRGELSPAQMAAWLIALRMRGETPEEIAGFALAMREYALRVPVQREGLLDTCGTGGDRLKTFNISTATAFVLAAAGVPVAKHGNRAVSSRCGSADVLEACGANLELSPEQVGEAIEQVGLGFLFAPRHHPAMKQVAPIRRELGVRTVFNLLGPLTNPAGAKRQLLGVFDSHWVPILAQVLHLLGSESALVVHGLDGLDEVFPIGATYVAELKPDGTVETTELTPADFGLKALSAQQIVAGATPEENARQLKAALSGEDEFLMTAVVINAAAAFRVAGKVGTWKEGAELATQVIRSGKARAKLEEYVAFSHR
ncbi:MAG: anthranilate phosphoribosyltransferase [candidate division WOR-3 bacterium]